METQIVTAWEIKSFDLIILEQEALHRPQQEPRPCEEWERDRVLHQLHGAGSQGTLVESLPLERADHTNQLKGTNMPYYRKKPIPLEARQYTGDNFLELQDWSDDHVALSDYNDDAICVYTLDGPMWFDEGDYIIKGVRGEFYPCQKDIFEETYEKVS